MSLSDSFWRVFFGWRVYRDHRLTVWVRGISEEAAASLFESIREETRDVRTDRETHMTFTYSYYIHR